jgi:hypothetical protein
MGLWERAILIPLGANKDVFGRSAGRDEGHHMLGVGHDDIEHEWAIMGDHFADGVTQIFFFVDPF